MGDTLLLIKPSPAPTASNQLTNRISTSTHHTHHHYSLPYYTLDTTGTRHDINACVTDAFPRRPHPQFHPARIADAKDDLTFRPPLRKKPKLMSNASDTISPLLPDSSPGMRKLVGISKTTSVPSFNSLSLNGNPDNNDRRPSSSSGITQSPHPLHRTNSTLLQRSPSQRRPPASHSSYGVETICGPPASYSTQRTLSQDRIRLDRGPGPRQSNSSLRESSPTKTKRDSSPSKARRDPSPSKIKDPAPETEPTHARLSPVKIDASPSTSEYSADEANTEEVSSPETVDTQSVVTPTSITSKDNTMLAAGATALQEKENAEPHLLRPVASEEDSKGSSSDEKKSEDLFLNIAKTDAPRSGGQTQSKLDKRRSRVSLPFLNSTRPSTGYKSSPIQERFETASVSGRSEAPNYYSKRSSLGQHVPGAFSRTYAQDSSIREGRLETQSSHPAEMPRRAMLRRYSTTNSNANTNTEPVRTFSRPSTARNSRMASESAFLDRPPMPDHNATESTISTTAPSTVWDELDDLKSRIKKLELTGKLPPSSAAAMTTSERPKTATTAATTTMSSSPKNKPVAVSPLQSAIEGIPSNIHPNLHEALGNAKAVLSNEVFQKLQATAQDALQLSMMMNPEGYNAAGSTLGIASVSERQIRRRTESMCRGLTELAIAILADNKQPPQPATRPGSRDAYQPMSGLRSRRYSNDTNDRPPVASRVQSRLETRRTSAAFGGTSNPQPTTPDTSYQTPPAAVPPMPASAPSRVGRTTSTLVRSRRSPGHNNGGTTDDEESSPSVRPVSRAMTEVSTYRQMARDRAAYSREYTAQHPMPQQPVAPTIDPTDVTRSQPSSHISTHLVPRRKYATVTSAASHVGSQEQTPVTPKEPWGRITIVPTPISSPISATPESQTSARAPPTRRSLGFTSRISSVSSRLRAAKGERNASTRGTPDSRAVRDMTPSGQILDNRTPLERHDSGQSIES